MARNSDGTVVLKTAGKLSRDYRGGGTTNFAAGATTYRGGGVGSGGQLNSYRRGWRVIGKSER